MLNARQLQWFAVNGMTNLLERIRNKHCAWKCITVILSGFLEYHHLPLQ